MLLGDMIRSFSSEAEANATLFACDDLILIARATKVGERFEENVAEYASGAVRRFANLAVSEDWLGLMNVIERAVDPAIGCLTYMLNWSLARDESPPKVEHVGCTCSSDGH